MADNRRQGRKPAAYRRWWLVPMVVVVCMLIAATLLVLFARALYNERDPDGFRSLLASGVLLNGAVVVILGAIVTTVLSIASEIRDRADRAARKRLELFRRMRDAHVRVVLAQQFLQSQQDAVTYQEQMRGLLSIVKELEEVREEVRVSGRLYAEPDRRAIAKGIAIIIDFLQNGVLEYVTWCRQGGGELPESRPQTADAWVAHLVADHDWGHRSHDPGDEDWEPAGRMPPAYDDGLELSKLVMRAYVYGGQDQSPRRDT